MQKDVSRAKISSRIRFSRLEIRVFDTFSTILGFFSILKISEVFCSKIFFHPVFLAGLVDPLGVFSDTFH